MIEGMNYGITKTKASANKYYCIALRYQCVVIVVVTALAIIKKNKPSSPATDLTC